MQNHDDALAKFQGRTEELHALQVSHAEAQGRRHDQIQENINTTQALLDIVITSAEGLQINIQSTSAKLAQLMGSFGGILGLVDLVRSWLCLAIVLAPMLFVLHRFRSRYARWTAIILGGSFDQTTKPRT